MKILKPYLLFLTCLSLLLFFSTCKKYPENTLWFKSPANIEFIEGNLTHYIVNGIDSINELDNFFYDLNNNPYSKNFSDFSFDSRPTRAKGYFEVNIITPQDTNGGPYISRVFKYRYMENSKKIRFSGTKGIFDAYKKNIFIDDSIIWEITMLKKNGARKMKGTCNGNTYELQFN